jgi:hypothetical protein
MPGQDQGYAMAPAPDGSNFGLPPGCQQGDPSCDPNAQQAQTDGGYPTQDATVAAEMSSSSDGTDFLSGFGRGRFGRLGRFGAATVPASPIPSWVWLGGAALLAWYLLKKKR